MVVHPKVGLLQLSEREMEQTQLVPERLDTEEVSSSSTTLKY